MNTDPFVIECHCHFKTMTLDVHAQDSVMTSLHVTRRTCTPGLTLLVYLEVWENWSTFFNEKYFFNIN